MQYLIFPSHKCQQLSQVRISIVSEQELENILLPVNIMFLKDKQGKKRNR